MKNNEFNLFYFMIIVISIAILLLSSWELFLHYWKKKQFSEAIKDKDSKYINEQMQGMFNDIKK